MSNKTVVPFAGSSLPVTKSLKAGLQNIKQEIGEMNSGASFLKMTRQGDWVYGQENIEVEQGARIAINPNTLMHGHIRWEGGQPKDEVMVSVMEPKPEKPAGCDDQYGMQMVVLNGEDEGLELVYKHNSFGFKKAFRKLVESIEAQLEVDENMCVPIIELDAESYPHKEYGTIWNPVLNIVEWQDGSGTEAVEEAAPEEQAATRRRRRS
jgi:hypothetical protein